MLRLLFTVSRRATSAINHTGCTRLKATCSTSQPLSQRFIEIKATPMMATSASPNNSHLQPPLDGTCHCGKTTYTLTASPIRVNCCHCRDCQQKSGSAFVSNVIIERSNVQVTSPTHPMTTEQSPGINIYRCSNCYVVLWSTIPSLGPDVAFVRAGTLEQCSKVRPDVHFFTRTKVDWLAIPEVVKAYEGGRPDGEPGYWTAEGKKRIEKVLGKEIW